MKDLVESIAEISDSPSLRCPFRRKALESNGWTFSKATQSYISKNNSKMTLEFCIFGKARDFYNAIIKDREMEKHLRKNTVTFVEKN